MKRNRYVHGFKGFVECVYGKDDQSDWKYVQPCSLREAKRIRRSIQIKNQKDYRIYKLVAIK